MSGAFGSKTCIASLEHTTQAEIVEFSDKRPACFDDLTTAMRDCEVAYYLIYSMVVAGGMTPANWNRMKHRTLLQYNDHYQKP